MFRFALLLCLSAVLARGELGLWLSDVSDTSDLSDVASLANGRDLWWIGARDEASRDRLRGHIRDHGWDGLFVVRVHAPGARLPFPDHMFNQVRVDRSWADAATHAEVLRVRIPEDPGGGTMDHSHGWTRGGAAVVAETLAPRRNFPGPWSLASPDGQGALESGLTPLRERWSADTHRNTEGKGRVQMALVGEGCLVILGRDSAAQTWRDGIRLLGDTNQLATLSVRDAFNGSLRWRRPTPGIRSMALAGKTLFALEGDELVAESLRSGERLFAVPAPPETFQILANERHVLLVSGNVMALDARSGELRWIWQQGPVTGARWAGDRIVLSIATGDRPTLQPFPWSKPRGISFVGLDASDGSQRWVMVARHTVQEGSLRLGAMNERYVLGLSDRKIHVFASEDGRVLRSIDAPDRGRSYQPQRIEDLDGDLLRVSLSRTKRLLEVTLPDGPVAEREEAPAAALGSWPCSGLGLHTRGLLSATPGESVSSPYLDTWGHLPLGSTCGVGAAAGHGLAFQLPMGCGCMVGRAKGLVASEAVPAGLPAAPGPLEKGPAFATPLRASTPGWRDFRADAQRSNGRAIRVGTLTPLWTNRLAMARTQLPLYREAWRDHPNTTAWLGAPTCSDDGLVFVPLPSEHAVLAVEAASGSPRWRFQADATVDTPPTFSGGRVFFGARDGYVYALDATTGELAWRRRVAPLDESVLRHGMLESRYPVRGAVVVRDGVVHAVAGQQGANGFWRAALDAATGDGKDWQRMPSFLGENDVLVANPRGDLFLGPLAWNQAREPTRGLWRVEELLRPMPQHLLWVDEPLANVTRTHSPVGQDWPRNVAKPPYASPQRSDGFWRSANTGRLLNGMRAADWAWLGGRAVGLMERSPPGVFTGGAVTTNQVPHGAVFMVQGRLPAISLGASNVLHAAAPAPVAWHRSAGDVWAMAQAADALLLAGPLLPEVPARELPEPLAGLGWLEVADPATGRTRQRIELPCAPMQDGFAIEGGRVFLSLADGRMIAFATSPP